VIRYAKVRARANIALAKYWGKSDDALNLPAVPSISVTLDPMITETTITLDPSLGADTFFLGAEPANPEETARVQKVLGEVRAKAGATTFARVESKNSFPPPRRGWPRAPRGSPPSRVRARAVYGLPTDDRATSILSRRASASAARSVLGGFVELPAGVKGDDGVAAIQLHPSLALAGASIGRRGDERGTQGRRLTRRDGGCRAAPRPTFRRGWDAAPAMATKVREGIAHKNLEALGPALEHSFSTMHALALSTSPPTIYWQPASVAALMTVRRLRDVEGVPVYATMDAGPHVKAVCTAEDEAKVIAALSATPGVLRTLVAKPGPGLEIEIG
jgi:diphosphomevalonate decarboxylase